MILVQISNFIITHAHVFLSKRMAQTPSSCQNQSPYHHVGVKLFSIQHVDLHQGAQWLRAERWFGTAVVATTTWRAIAKEAASWVYQGGSGFKKLVNCNLLTQKTQGINELWYNSVNSPWNFRVGDLSLSCSIFLVYDPYELMSSLSYRQECFHLLWLHSVLKSKYITRCCFQIFSVSPQTLGFHDPIWRTHIFFRWVEPQPPTSIIFPNRTWNGNWTLWRCISYWK